MSRPGLPTSPYTPVFGVPSLAGIRPPRVPAAASLGVGTGITGGPSLEEAMDYISNISRDLQPEQEDTAPYIAFSPSSKQLYVNGFTFAENDAARALESEQYLGQSAARPEAGDWQRIPASVYQDYLQSIRDPSLGTRFAKSFSSGVGSLQQLWGAALMAATGGEVGQGLYEAGAARMERLQPFAKKFSEVKNLDDAGDFMVSLLGSQAPNILESITTALIGAGLGAAAGTSTGPFGTAAGGVGGAAAGLLAKGAVKNQLRNIARKKLAKQALTPDEDALWKSQAGPTGAAIQLAARKKAAGEALSPDEQKLLRQGAAVTGALTLSTLEGYGIGVGDVYSEMLEQGVADEPGARAAAFGYAVPYAALSAAPEFLGALTLLRPTTSTGFRAAAGRFGTGFAVGATSEGVSEASQEGLIMGAAGQFGAQYTPQERGERLFEAGVAGAALGGLIGGPVNLLRRPEPPAPAPSAPPEQLQIGYDRPEEVDSDAPIITPAPTPRLGLPAPARVPEGPTFADITDLPEPPEPRSILAPQQGIPPSYQRADFEGVPLEAQYAGGMQQQEEFFAAPPVRPGQENMLFQDQDLGPVVTAPAKEPVAGPPAVEPGQQTLFTIKGKVSPVVAAATANQPKTLSEKQQQSLKWLKRQLGELFPEQVELNLVTADNVLVQPNKINRNKFVASNTGDTIELIMSGDVLKEPKTIAYDEALYGSPQEFAQAMGIDAGAVDTVPFIRYRKDGSSTAPMDVRDYKPVQRPPTVNTAEREEKRAGSSLRRGRAAAEAAAEAPVSPTKKNIRKKARAVQEPEAASVDVREQAGTGKGIRKKDTAGSEAAGKSKAETAQEEPVREAGVEEVVATEYPPLARQYSEIDVFGTFQRVRYMRRGDMYIEQKRMDEVSNYGRITKPGTWKYSSVLLTKEEADARYARRKNTDYYKRDVAVDLEKLPEGPPPPRRRLTEEADVTPALPTVVDFPTTKKDENGRFTVTLSDGSTAKVYYDKSGSVLRGWYSDERSKFAPSQPGYVSDYLGINREEAIENLPEVLARLRAEKALSPSGKKGLKKKTEDLDNQDLIAEAQGLELTRGNKDYVIGVMKELQLRVINEAGTEAELGQISDILSNFGESVSARPFLEAARKQLAEEAEPGSGQYSRVTGFNVYPKKNIPIFRARFPITADTLSRIDDDKINQLLLMQDLPRDEQRILDIYPFEVEDRMSPEEQSKLKDAESKVYATASAIVERLDELSDARMEALQKGGLLKFKDGQVVRDSNDKDAAPMLVIRTHAHPEQTGPYGYMVYDTGLSAYNNDKRRLITNEDPEFDRLVVIEASEKDPYGEYAQAVSKLTDNIPVAQATLNNIYHDKIMEREGIAAREAEEAAINRAIESTARDASLTKGNSYTFLGTDRPMRFEGAYTKGSKENRESGIRFSDANGKMYDIPLRTMDGTLTPEDTLRLVAIGNTKMGPRLVGRFSRGGRLSDSDLKRDIGIAIDTIMSRLAPSVRNNLNVVITQNQGTLSRQNPTVYRSANMSRISDLSAKDQGAATEQLEMSAELEAWFDNLPDDVKKDPSMVRAVFALFEDHKSGEGKFLINPTYSEAYALWNRRRAINGPHFVIKMLRTEQGNIIAYDTGDLGDHADAAVYFGLKEGEFHRGNLALNPEAWFDERSKLTSRPVRIRGKRLTAKDFVVFNEYAEKQFKAYQKELYSFRNEDSNMGPATRYQKVLFDIMLAQADAGVINDFDTTPAAGFYYKTRDGKGNIIIFTDRITDVNHALRVFAEEAVGHHGLAALLGKDLTPIMQALYDENASIRAAADGFARRVREELKQDVSIAEAVEEVLADSIAQQLVQEAGFPVSGADNLHVEVGLLTRAINAIKKLLNNLFGRRTLFDDEDVRQLLADVRKYTTTGVRSSALRTRFNMRQAYEDGTFDTEGRFSRMPVDGQEPVNAMRLTAEERGTLGNTTKADVYEMAINGAGNEAIVNALGLKNTNVVKSLLTQARADLAKAGVPMRSTKRAKKTPKKQQQALVALSTRKPGGDYPTAAEAAEAAGLDISTVYSAMKAAREDYARRGMAIPDYLVPRRMGRYSRVSGLSEYGQATSPLYIPQRPLPRELADALDWFEDRKTNAGQLVNDVLNALKTMNFASRSNAGYREGYRILTDMKNTISQLRAKYNALLEDTLANTDQKVRLQVSEMLQFTTQAKMTGLTDRDLRAMPKLFKVEGNAIIVNPKVFETLSRMGRFTIDEFRKGITRTQEVPFVDENDEIKTRVETYTLKAMPDLTEDSIVWKLYQQVRETMDEAAIDRVRADYAAAFGARENVFETIQDLTGKILTAADKDLIANVDARYRVLVKEGATQDETGKLIYKIKATENASKLMADFNRVLIAKTEDKDRLDAFASHFPEDVRAEVIQQIKDLRKGMTFSEANKYDVQRVVTDLAALELGKEDSELHAKRSIAGGYVPLGRTGRWQTRIRAVDPVTGQVYGVMESFRSQLPYFQHEDRAAAERLAKEINQLFPAGKATVKIPVLDAKTGNYTVKEVRLEAVADAARETQSVDPGININEFMRMITRFGVTLTPQERERIIIGMTEQNARARTNLQRQNVRGQDPDSVPYIAQHLETLANITGRRTHQHRTDKLLDEKNPRSQRAWNGDPTRLKALKERYEELKASSTAPTAALTQAEREYNQYAFEMRRTQEEGGAAVFKDRFVRDLAFLEEQKALEYADFASDGLGQSVRTWTAVAQLGGSLATAALNILSVPMNVLPALASYNPKNNFGGGFGMGKSSVALSAAIKDVGGLNRYRQDYYKNLLKDKAALDKSGLTRDEAAFLAREIEFGNLQAALANALTASAKGRFGRSPRVQKFIDTYMSAFTYSEQAARRASALAAYRLERDRQIEAGIDSVTASNAAERFAIDLTNDALGNYAMYNRPGAFRGGLRDFIFMYKMYPITVVQLLSSLSLSMSGKAAMLVALFVLSGFKGMPFAEDLSDILDTIMQKLGFKVASSEGWLADQLNEIAPGLTPTLMRGVVDQLIPATVSSRTGLGNMLPGTSLFVAGANQYNEIMDFVGPAAAFVEGSLATAAATTQTGLAAIGLSDRQASLSGILRGSPVTMMRAAGDVLEYAQTGAIVDSKGYVSSYDLNAGTYAARLLGFYPSAATRQNDVVRVTKREADYIREVSTEFRRSYVKAALRNDSEGMQRVVQRVRDWNDAARGTGLEIPNFAINARRAVQEARKTASERYVTSAPRSLRTEVRAAQEAYGAQ